MDVLTDTVSLSRSLFLKSNEVITTIGESALYITKLPREYDGRLHWMTAGSNLEAASKHHTADLIEVATDSMAIALATDAFLKS